MSSYRDLRVWQDAIDLAIAVYAASEAFPARENFCLTQQMRRAVVSISSNIAEGKGRHSTRDFSHFLFQARGSTLELDSQLEIAMRLGYLSSECAADLQSQTSNLARGLNALINSIQEPVAVAASHH